MLSDLRPYFTWFDEAIPEKSLVKVFILIKT